MHTPSAADQATRNELKGLLDRPVVLFANDWYTDPTSKHHVATVLSEATAVVWVESSGMRVPRLSAADLGRMWRKLSGRRGEARRPTTQPPVHIVSPLAVPLPGVAPAEWLNGWIYRRAIGRTIGSIGAGRDPLLWVYTPTTAPYLDRVPHEGLVYHFVDRWWEFTEYDARTMRRHHERLCRSADVVFASAQELLEDCVGLTDRAHLVRHGVDWEHFSTAALGELPVPEDIADIEGPIVGFFGLIHDWIDRSVLLRVAEAWPEVTLVLIGEARVDVEALRRRDNVRLLGRRPYAALPAYARRFDVGLIPFVVNELTRAVNPIKLREYLSAGLPVVSTALPEIAVFGGLTSVHIADDSDHFVELVGFALATEGGASERAERARAMESESWHGRTLEMVRLWKGSR